MMEPATLLAFVLASAALIAVPGPNVAVIVATGAAHGRRAALTVVAGATLAQAGQIALVAAGLAAFLAAFGWTLTVIKWAGVAYLAWLGVSALMAKAHTGEARPVSARRLFATGAATALANPKTLVFHAAFLPLFVSPDHPAGPQLFILGGVYILVALTLDSLYAVLAGWMKTALSRFDIQTLARRGSGVLMLFAAGWLALRRAE
ncbi:LysE family translocator [Alkalicaulis satelles]|uniref:LysE family translocator n=2 Tax=Alkalicaulis satelles TaxID=2609175 RepID=A0A5M6ZNN7_9PROT|nr:LysE family translocator [Alkalicaulis satelles]